MLDAKKLNEQLTKTEEFFKKELSGIRTGRAHPSLIEGLEIEAYDSKMKLKEVATITTPEARSIRIEPWDKGQMGAIEKAIQVSDLGLNPSNDGTAIVVNLPELTKERREEIAKSVGSKIEEAKVSIRNVRGEFLKELSSKNSDGDLSDDEFEKDKKELQTVIDEYNGKIDEFGKKKQEEIVSM